MSFSTHLNFFGEDFTVEDPSEISSWMLALKPILDEWSKQHHGEKYYLYGHPDYSDKHLKEVATAIGKAISAYRKDTVDLDPAIRQTYWQGYLCQYLEELEGEEPECAQLEAMDSQNFEDVYEQLDEVLQEVDGPVPCLDELFQQIKDTTLELMSEKDTSSILELYRSISVPLAFTPDFDPHTDSFDDHMIQTDKSISEYDDNMLKLLKLYRVKFEDVIENVDIDFTDESKLEKMDTLFGLKFEHPPVASVDEIRTVFDNCNSYALPVWFGKIPMAQIMSLDFHNTVEVSGGLVGMHDAINGSGYMDTTAATFYITANDWLGEELGQYSIDSVFGFVGSAYKATAKQGAKAKPTLRVEMDDYSPT